MRILVRTPIHPGEIVTDELAEPRLSVERLGMFLPSSPVRFTRAYVESRVFPQALLRDWIRVSACRLISR